MGRGRVLRRGWVWWSGRESWIGGREYVRENLVD